MVQLLPQLKGQRGTTGAGRNIYDRLRAQIADGTLPTGAPVPSTRGLAAELVVSRTTVTAAFEQLAAEAVANRRFDKFWAQEEAWIRRGVEARRTRNEGRVARLTRLREERETLQKAEMAVSTSRVLSTPGLSTTSATTRLPTIGDLRPRT